LQLPQLWRFWGEQLLDSFVVTSSFSERLYFLRRDEA
jgi:hypothetical protein